MFDILKRMGRYASLNHNIYIAADTTPVDVDHLFWTFKGPFPGKCHVFVLALLYLFECLNE